MTPEQRKEMILKFKGFGNPLGDKKFCFIGIEESVGFDKSWSDNEIDNEILRSYFKDYSPEGPSDYYSYKKIYSDLFQRPYTQVYEIMAKLIHGLMPELIVKEILDKYLFTCNGLAFQMNLYPLGKNHMDVKLPDIVLKRFGFTGQEDYLSSMKTSRFPRLYEFWNSMNFGLTICFGKENWEDFRDCLHLNEIRPVRDESGKFELYGGKVVLTHFFANYNFSEQGIDKFVNFIKSNKTNCQ